MVRSLTDCLVVQTGLLQCAEYGEGHSCGGWVNGAYNPTATAAAESLLPQTASCDSHDKLRGYTPGRLTPSLGALDEETTGRKQLPNVYRRTGVREKRHAFSSRFLTNSGSWEVRASGGTWLGGDSSNYTPGGQGARRRREKGGKLRGKETEGARHSAAPCLRSVSI